MKQIDLRAIIAAEQKRRGLTDYALAQLAGCKAEKYRAYLDAKRECRSDVLERLLTALELRITR